MAEEQGRSGGKSYGNRGYGSGRSGGYRKSDAIPKTAIEEIVRLPFEGHLINAPAGYETYLHTLYGDYHQLPPEDQRHPAHVGDAYWR